jgi:hypothetical protein
MIRGRLRRARLRWRLAERIRYQIVAGHCPLWALTDYADIGHPEWTETDAVKVRAEAEALLDDILAACADALGEPPSANPGPDPQ